MPIAHDYVGTLHVVSKDTVLLRAVQFQYHRYERPISHTDAPKSNTTPICSYFCTLKSLFLSLVSQLISILLLTRTHWLTRNKLNAHQKLAQNRYHVNWSQLCAIPQWFQILNYRSVLMLLKNKIDKFQKFADYQNAERRWQREKRGKLCIMHRLCFRCLDRKVTIFRANEIPFELVS